MVSDDIIYVSLLIVSIIIGPYLRHIDNVQTRKRASALVGFLLVLVVSGKQILHPVFAVVVNSIITLYLNKRICHTVSFVFCFSYLAFARLCHVFDAFSPIPPYVNAVQMILTLKMVGLAFEVHDTYVRRKEKKESKESLEQEFLNVDPSFLDIFCYSFCHAGVLTGPYYKYRTYWDSFHLSYSKQIDYIPYLINRIKFVPMYAALYLLSGYIFPLEYAESEEIFTRSFWYRVWYITPMFFNFRMRIYSGFVLSECQCISAGLGAYPTECKSKSGQGPTDLTPMKRKDEGSMPASYDFGTVNNINEYQADFVSTVREGMRNWNMTVQYWLAMFVYKRVPWKNLRVSITMLMSAFWHGVYPGYYICLLTVPFQLMAEDAMANAFRRDATARGQLTYDWICWFFKMQAFAYMGVGFLLLRIDTTLNYYKSIYFIGHVLMLVFYIFGRHVSTLKRKQNKKDLQLHESSKDSTKKSD